MPDAATTKTIDATFLRERIRRPPSRTTRWKERGIEVMLALCGAVSMAAVALIFIFMFKEGFAAFGMTHPSQFIISSYKESAFNPVTEEFTTTDRRGYIWQPVGDDPKISFIPLMWGSFLVAAVAAVISTLVGIAIGIFLSEMATPRVRSRLKPALEVLVGIPTVVIGFFMLVIVAQPLRDSVRWLAGAVGLNGLAIYPDSFNAWVGALGVSLVIIPVIASLVDDALAAVGHELREGSLGLGATRWQTTWRVVLPAAFSGVSAAVILGFGRALGETMIVVMCSGNAAQIRLNPFESVTTMTARIATEMGAAKVGSLHAHTLFLVGALLVTITFVLNVVAEVIIQRYRRKHVH